MKASFATLVVVASGLLFVSAPGLAQQLKSRTASPVPWTGCCATCTSGSCTQCSELIGDKCGFGNIKADCTTIADTTICTVPRQ
jgi:hypothetical protein